MTAKTKFKSHRNTYRSKTKQSTKTHASIGQQAYPNPPRGYVFVPKGDVYITRTCTTLTREAGQEVRIVYVSCRRIVLDSQLTVTGPKCKPDRAPCTRA